MSLIYSIKSLQCCGMSLVWIWRDSSPLDHHWRALHVMHCLVFIFCREAFIAYQTSVCACPCGSIPMYINWSLYHRRANCCLSRKLSSWEWIQCRAFPAIIIKLLHFLLCLVDLSLTLFVYKDLRTERVKMKDGHSFEMIISGTLELLVVSLHMQGTCVELHDFSFLGITFQL